MIVEATVEDALEVMQNIRADDFAECMAFRFNNDLVEFANDCMKLPGIKMAARYKGKTVAIGGVACWYPKVGQAWLVGTPEVGLLGREIVTYCKNQIQEMFASGYVHRIEAYSAAFHTPAHIWLKSIGMKEESRQPMRGKNGEEFIVFAVTRK